MKRVRELIEDLKRWDPDAQLLCIDGDKVKLFDIGESRLFFANNIPLSVVIPIIPCKINEELEIYSGKSGDCDCE